MAILPRFDFVRANDSLNRVDAMQAARPWQDQFVCVERPLWAMARLKPPASLEFTIAPNNGNGASGQTLRPNGFQLIAVGQLAAREKPAIMREVIR